MKQEQSQPQEGAKEQSLNDSLIKQLVKKYEDKITSAESLKHKGTGSFSTIPTKTDIERLDVRINERRAFLDDLKALIYQEVQQAEQPVKKPLSLQECKQKIAEKYGESRWNDLLLFNHPKYNIIDSKIEKAYDEVAELYASQPQPVQPVKEEDQEEIEHLVAKIIARQTNSDYLDALDLIDLLNQQGYSLTKK